MDLSKIKTLIDFVGRSTVSELTVTRKDVTVRIFRSASDGAAATVDAAPEISSDTDLKASESPSLATAVRAPIFGVLHRASAPGQPPFVDAGDSVEEGDTLFIVEAMKVFNKITAPCAGRIIFLTDIDGGEVHANELLAEIA
ncbi:biotin/lipoyl-containing protein [Rhizobium sp. NFACC06-2]|uniref:acetyl-CoA carboxylase biotin carboxyl carrier protein n=1 Tax=Rhizobium sp. NFACC06-2 TaxID=1566264 RepID=UPI00087727FF|nr:biotin/lipoyl-containing protein [Rhizobium sp. NFACC06-2]SCY92948.1 acetyl-CoA carboxylase biotin carboxyl carrier protein [Rhizobium sp. NFACC06-2]